MKGLFTTLSIITLYRVSRFTYCYAECRYAVSWSPVRYAPTINVNVKLFLIFCQVYKRSSLLCWSVGAEEK
jgi:hypothetical protein